jgi:hypothetical protein
VINTESLATEERVRLPETVKFVYVLFPLNTKLSRLATLSTRSLPPIYSTDTAASEVSFDQYTIYWTNKNKQVRH